MGAWDAGSFDNDDAADWAYAFEGLDRETGLHFISETLVTTLTLPIDADIGAAVVAAATVVTWLAGNEDGIDSVYAETVAGWVREHREAPSADLVRVAREALRRVGTDDSELAQLWREAGDAAWRGELQRIDEALANAG